MAAFFPDLLDGFTEPAFLEKVRTKFHFGEAQSEKLQKVAEEMLPWMRREAFWESRPSRVRDGQGQHAESIGEDADESTGAVYEDVVMSLGGGLDSLQESYTEKGMLSESYMLETLASEILLKGYGAYNRSVQEHTKLHVARYYFPGSEAQLPLDMVPVLLQGFDRRVTCNDAFCILPKKSVVFIARLTQDAQMRCESICVGCGNIHCPNRVPDDSPRGRLLARMADLPMSYGYSRILGKPRQP